MFDRRAALLGAVAAGETKTQEVKSRMKIPFVSVRLIAACSLLLAGTALFATDPRFSDYAPLTSSAGPTTNEAVPVTFGNPAIQQTSIADRDTQVLHAKPNTGNWDMNTLNETGPHPGRFLFTVFETGQAGVQRIDLRS